MKGSTSKGKNDVMVRLATLVILPMVALVLTSGWLLLDSISMEQKAENSVVYSNTATKASALLHELQKERGMSAGYLGSKGTAFQNDLPIQRQKTDQRYAELKEFIEQEAVLEANEMLAKQLGDALELLLRVASVRTSVDSMNTSMGEAIGYYTKTNSHLIHAIALLPSIAPNPEIAAQAQPYLNLIHMKENAGIERAVLAGTFARNSFSPELYQKFIGLVAKQKSFKSLFEESAPENAKQLLADAFSASHSKTAESMRQTALRLNLEGNFNIDPKAWFKAQTGKINELKAVEDQLAIGLKAEASALLDAATTTLWAVLIFALTTIVGTAALGGNIARKLSVETREMTKALEAIASGDLTDAEIDYDRIGSTRTSLETMRSKLTNITGQIQESVDTLRSASREISDKNNSLATRAEEQGRHLENAASDMTRITETVRQNASDASKGNMLANDAMEHATKGQSIVSKAVEAMNEINGDSKKIAEIINVIDDIAFQTNLLALNAAVEAARAGEQGRGFAVVASEVRNLAQRSAEAAHEIKGLIETSVKKVENGSDLVNASGSSLNGIVEAVEDCKKLMNQIAHASEEQAKSVENMSDSITGLDSANQENTAMVEEVAVSSLELTSQARKLAEITSFYKVDRHQPSSKQPRFGAKPAPQTQASIQKPVTTVNKPPLERRSPNRPFTGNAANVPKPETTQKPLEQPKFEVAAGGSQDWTSF